MWLVLTVLFRRSRFGTREDGRHVRVKHLLRALTLAIVVLAVAVPTPATAQVDSPDAPIIGTAVTLERARGSAVSGAGPVAIDDSVEFPDCCPGPNEGRAWDIDIATDRITMTWADDGNAAEVITAGTTETLTFTFADANFKRAFADQSQLLAPEVTWTSNSITMTLAEGDEVGPGRNIVVLVTPFAPNPAGSTDVDGPTTDDADADADDADDTAEDETAAEAEDQLPRTGVTDSGWLALIATTLVGAGLVLFGSSLRTDR